MCVLFFKSSLFKSLCNLYPKWEKMYLCGCMWPFIIVIGYVPYPIDSVTLRLHSGLTGSWGWVVKRYFTADKSIKHNGMLQKKTVSILTSVWPYWLLVCLQLGVSKGKYEEECRISSRAAGFPSEMAAGVNSGQGLILTSRLKDIKEYLCKFCIDFISIIVKFVYKFK